MLSKRALIAVGTLLFTLALTGCKKQRYSGEQSPGTGADVGEVTWYVPQNQNYNTLKAKALITMSNLSLFGGIKSTINVAVGRSLMISIQPLLGIEMYRVTCTQDSIIFIDKMTRSYVAEPYKYFTSKDFNLNYEMIEGLLCNRFFDPVKDNYRNMTLKVMGNDSVFHCQAPNYYVEFLVQKTINRTLFSTNDGMQYILADYNNTYQTQDGYTFPMSAVCTLSSPKLSFSTNINFESVDFNQDVTIVADIPSGYSKSKFESLIK